MHTLPARARALVGFDQSVTSSANAALKCAIMKRSREVSFRSFVTFFCGFFKVLTALVLEEPPVHLLKERTDVLCSLAGLDVADGRVTPVNAWRAAAKICVERSINPAHDP